MLHWEGCLIYFSNLYFSINANQFYFKVFLYFTFRLLNLRFDLDLSTDLASIGLSWYGTAQDLLYLYRVAPQFSVWVGPPGPAWAENRGVTGWYQRNWLPRVSG